MQLLLICEFKNYEILHIYFAACNNPTVKISGQSSMKKKIQIFEPPWITTSNFILFQH